MSSCMSVGSQIIFIAKALIEFKNRKCILVFFVNEENIPCHICTFMIDLSQISSVSWEPLAGEDEKAKI